ncbi:MAG: CoA transferase [Dehalococcoidia bacterium]
MSKLPLEGVRVLDLTVVWAGPFAGQLLAEWGAEVIRMEPLTALQPQTRGVEGSRHVTREFVRREAERGAFTGAFPNRDPGDDPWNRRVTFNSSSANKRSFTGNIRTEAGHEAFMRLVEISDIVIENNVPETITKMHVTYEELREVNPRIIMVRMPGFGLSGECANYRCWGNHLEGMAGHHLVRSYPDMTLDAAGESYACDSIAGLNAAVGAVMALRHRRRTGRGQQVEVPQIEAFVQMMGVEILDFTMNGRVAGAMGNDHRTHAPHNVYRCAPEGERDDCWIAIDARTDEEFEAVCGVLEAPGLASDERFADSLSRYRHRRELDVELGALTRSRSRLELFEALQAVGVPAGPVQDEADAFACPQLRERDWFEPITRDDIGTFDQPGYLFQFDGTEMPPRRPPPRLGEDNEYVYRELLGMDKAEYEALVASGEVGTRYPDWLLERV